MIPLEVSCSQAEKEMDELLNSPEVVWAVQIVGEEFFDSYSVSKFLQLINSHRADSLKEAINLYDQEEYQNRMASLQEDIKSAAEISAAESVKQTEYARRTEQHTNATARAARANARINYANYKVNRANYEVNRANYKINRDKYKNR